MKYNMASYLESTLLSPVARKEAVIELCHEAIAYNFVAVCIHPTYIPLAAPLLQGTAVKVVTVAGFPLGASDYRVKAREAALAVKNGAAEIDMVINLAALKNGDNELLIREVAAVVACGATTKVIIETGYLTREEISMACSCIQEGGAHFVKSCTGFGPRGVTLEDILLLRSLLPTAMGIKAAAGIKSASFAGELIEAGATRIGTSAAATIITQASR